MANNKPSDKRITTEQINFILKALQELPFKNVNAIIQLMLSLKDIETNSNNVNKKNTTESK
jgi:hypothetical protein|tara:strand:- start:245 stop:427 length:183 start_codon:yes stop_codon:yes gene_type:complete